jgi:tetratricopeptide (TPR) repeat protein
MGWRGSDDGARPRALDDLWEQAEALSTAGRPLEAAALLQEVEARAPDPIMRGTAAAIRGEALLQDGQADAAEPSLRTAVALLGPATAAAPPGDQHEELSRLLAQTLWLLAEHLTGSGRAAEALAAVGEVLALGEGLASATAGELAVYGADLAHDQGATATAEAWWAVALDRCAPGPGRAAAAVEVARIARRGGDHRRAADLLAEAIALHEADDDPLAATRVRTMAMEVLVDCGREEEAEAVGRRAVEDAVRLGEHDLATRARAGLVVLGVSRDPSETELLDDPGDDPHSLIAAATAALGTNRLATAEALLDAAEATGRITTPGARGGLAYLRGMVAVGSGRLADAKVLLEQARDAYPVADRAQIDAALALVEMGQGDATAAATRAHAAAGSLAAADMVADSGRTLLLASQAELAAGRVEAAAATARRAVDALARGPRRELHALARLVAAAALGATDPSAGLDAMAPGLGSFDDIRHRLRGTPHRTAYTERTSGIYDVAIRMALRAGRPRAVAELVLRAQGQVLPQPVAAPALGADLPAAPADGPEAPDQPGRLGPDDLLPLAPPTTVAVALDGPPLVAPPGRPVVALPTVAEAVTGSAHWTWWTSWAGADDLHWAVVDHDGQTHCGSSRRGPIEAAVAELAAAVAAGSGHATGALLDPDLDAALARRLGEVLLPEVIRERIATGAGPDWHVVIHPAALAGGVPYGWLAGAGDRRLLEAATIHHAAPLPILAHLLTRPPAPAGSGACCVIDPGGRALFAIPPAAPPGPVATRPEHREWYDVGGRTVAPASLAAVRGLGGSPPRVLSAYVGHVDGATDDSPAAASLLLADGDLSARRWIEDPDAWPAARTCALLGCSSAGQTHGEWSGLATAALWQGSRRVVSGVWDLANQPPTTAFVEDLLARLAGGEDASAAVGALQRSALASWRATGSRDDAPLYWAPFTSSGLAP